MEFWWAHQDLNLGPTNFEALERGTLSVRKLKTLNQFFLTEHPILSEAGPYPNDTSVFAASEPLKLKAVTRFLAVECRTGTEPEKRLLVSYVSYPFTAILLKQVLIETFTCRKILQLEACMTYGYFKFKRKVQIKKGINDS